MDEIEMKFKMGDIEFITAVMMLEADGLSSVEAEDQVLLWEHEIEEANGQFGVGA